MVCCSPLNVVQHVGDQTVDRSNALTFAVESRVFTSADGGVLKAVDNLSFAVREQSLTCIVGPSGCGKTTSLRMILGLDNNYKGHITRSEQGPVSVVFQEPRLLPWRTVIENVELVLHGQSPSIAMSSLFDQLGLTHVKDFYPAELSLGLARRAALARAFVVAPQLLVLDEPFVSLDDDTAQRLRRVLLTMLEHHPTTTLMVTHNLREAAQLADTVLVFSERPAKLLAEINIDLPRSERDETATTEIVNRITIASGTHSV